MLFDDDDDDDDERSRIIIKRRTVCGGGGRGIVMLDEDISSSSIRTVEFLHRKSWVKTYDEVFTRFQKKSNNYVTLSGVMRYVDCEDIIMNFKVFDITYGNIQSHLGCQLHDWIVRNCIKDDDDEEGVKYIISLTPPPQDIWLIAAAEEEERAVLVDYIDGSRRSKTICFHHAK